MRANRLLSLLLLLHARGRMTADELARQLEVSERTIYRDIDALSIAGVPVYTQPGTNGGVFLDENYRVSLTGLSKDEVLSLFVSSDGGPLNDLGMGKAVSESLLKLFAALPAGHRQEVERLHQRFYIDTVGWLWEGDSNSALPIVQQAVWEDRIISIIYQDANGATHERILEAYALVAKANIWYLVGKKSNSEPRTYRVSRIFSAEIQEERFQRDPDFDLVSYWKAACEQFEREMLENYPPYYATLRVHPHGMWYFPNFMNGRYEQISEPDADGWTTLHVTFGAEGDAVMKVLGLGARVDVIHPQSLKARVIQQAKEVLAFHGEDSPA